MENPIPTYNNFEELRAAQGGGDMATFNPEQPLISERQRFVTINQPHLHIEGNLIDFCVERYDQVGNGYLGNDSPPITSTADKEKLKKVCSGSVPFYGTVTVGHSKLPGGNVVIYDGKEVKMVTLSDDELKELQASSLCFYLLNGKRKCIWIEVQYGQRQTRTLS